MKKDLDPTTEDEATLRNEIEKENASRNLHVVQVIPLRRSKKHLSKVTAHHSIVIFTKSEKSGLRRTKGRAIFTTSQAQIGAGHKNNR